MKNNKFFFGVVVVFVLLGAFFVFFFGFKAVRAQFGARAVKAVAQQVNHSDKLVPVTVGDVGSVKLVVTDVSAAVVESLNVKDVTAVNGPVLSQLHTVDVDQDIMGADTVGLKPVLV